jgi:REP element-mobilizing transposase RayT
MDEAESLSHTKWECKYHVVFIPKYRRKTLYGELRKHWARWSADWRRKRRAESKRVVSYRTTYIC